MLDMKICISLQWRHNERTVVQITGVSILYFCWSADKKIKARRHMPLWGEFAGNRWFPAQRASNAENVFIWWRHHVMLELYFPELTYLSRVTHLCVGNLIIIGSDNGLSLGRRQVIIWTNAGILLIGPSWTNFSEIVIKIYTFPLKKIHLRSRL